MTRTPFDIQINHAAPPEAVAIDKPIAESGCCPECGGEELRYASHYTKNPYSYRAFSVCVDCGHAEEF